jgi:hypothetical protein
MKQLRLHADKATAGAGAINCQGPLINKIMHRFAAKIGYALHYRETGQPVPVSGGASVCWYTNWDNLMGNIPKELFSFLGAPQTLRQGQWQVEDQFSYSSAHVDTGMMSVHFATFRHSFAICAFVAARIEDVRPPGNAKRVTTHKPGWL